MRNLERNESVKEIWSMSRHVRMSRNENHDIFKAEDGLQGREVRHDQTCEPAQQLASASSSTGSCFTLTQGTMKTIPTNGLLPSSVNQSL